VTVNTARHGLLWHLRIALLETRFQFLSSLRLPAFAVPTLLFPLFFYFFFAVLFQAGGPSLTGPTYMLATYGVFGVLAPSIFGFGVGLAQERDTGALLLKRTTPMPTAAYLFARVGTARPVGKKRALSARVCSLSSTTLVALSSGDPGSLKAMWPLDPTPSNCSPIDADRTDSS